MERRARASDAAGMQRHYTRYTADQRSKLVELVRAGTAVPEAAARAGVKVATAYTWTRGARSSRPAHDRGTGRPRRSRSAPASGPLFARLVPADNREARIVVRLGDVAIEVRTGFDATLLQAVVVALRGGPA